ncbi:hypothetical protein KKF86_05230, partial [bacterium]|nr:hypothetical protein [bacterium]
MNYWMTTHWPPRENDNVDSEEFYWIYLPNGRQQAGERARVDDLLWIYESRTGRQLLGERYDYMVGRLGIIAIARIISELEPRNRGLEQYHDGTQIEWNWQIRTDLIKTCYIPRFEVCDALNYSRNYFFRGFGDLHSGLKL